MKIELEPIGYVQSSRNEIEDDYWGNVVSTLVINTDKYGENCLQGLEMFSHLEVIFYMHKLNPTEVYSGARHPRNNPAFPKMGILAQRVKNRPNLLGLSRCKILKVESDRVTVLGLDALDGSPILDIKPYMKEFNPTEVILQPDWVSQVMLNYYKP